MTQMKQSGGCFGMRQTAKESAQKNDCFVFPKCVQSQQQNLIEHQ
jgi:hypothetical protein